MFCSDSKYISNTENMEMKIFPIFHWHPLLERHFPIRSGTLKPVQQAALEIPQPRHDSQGSDGTRAV